jgi:hypothetical protein
MIYPEVLQQLPVACYLPSELPHVAFPSSSQPAFLWGLQLEEALAQKYQEDHPYVQPEAETESKTL